jgi:hypothetical protein
VAAVVDVATTAAAAAAPGPAESFSAANKAWVDAHAQDFGTLLKFAREAVPHHVRLTDANGPAFVEWATRTGLLYQRIRLTRKQLADKPGARVPKTPAQLEAELREREHGLAYQPDAESRAHLERYYLGRTAAAPEVIVARVVDVPPVQTGPRRIVPRAVDAAAAAAEHVPNAFRPADAAPEPEVDTDEESTFDENDWDELPDPPKPLPASLQPSHDFPSTPGLLRFMAHFQPSLKPQDENEREVHAAWMKEVYDTWAGRSLPRHEQFLKDLRRLTTNLNRRHLELNPEATVYVPDETLLNAIFKREYEQKLKRSEFLQLFQGIEDDWVNLRRRKTFGDAELAQLGQSAADFGTDRELVFSNAPLPEDYDSDKEPAFTFAPAEQTELKEGEAQRLQEGRVVGILERVRKRLRRYDRVTGVGSEYEYSVYEGSGAMGDLKPVLQRMLDEGRIPDHLREVGRKLLKIRPKKRKTTGGKPGRQLGTPPPVCGAVRHTPHGWFRLVPRALRF